MNEEMGRIVDDYVALLRRSMKGITEDVAGEVEREIRAHIEDALAARDASTVGALLDVLERLGPPEDYAPDLGLYAMVDRGYRDWSVPHMFRSTAVWALSTLAGAVALISFGLLFAGAAALTLGGLMRLMPAGLFGLITGVRPSPSPEPTAVELAPLLLATGLLALSGATGLVRWFVGQYVQRGRPDVLGGADADPRWAARTSRRIVAIASVGLAMAAATGLRSGGSWLRDPSAIGSLGEVASSPNMWLGLAGVLVFLMAPVLGLLWASAAEGAAEHSKT